MLNILRAAAVGLALWPVTAAAEPITLKLAFGTSDQSISYRAAARPFVEAINSETDGPVRIPAIGSC